MSEDFKEKVAVVTGGTGALGKVVVQKFFDAGAKVTITYLIDQELNFFPQQLKNTTDRIHIIKSDVAREEDANVFKRTAQKFGSVDFLANIAGGYLGKTPIVELQLKDWERMFSMNLTSAFLCSREALKMMVRKNFGRIVNIYAMPGLFPSAGRGAYAISKAGVAVLTKIIADEVKGTGITANAIAPSIIATEANIKASPGENYSRWVKPEEVAELIMYLCSESGKSINGAVIKILVGFKAVAFF